MNLLSIAGNFKTAKNIGYISAELSLAPANASGYNVCPKASVGCKAACIGWFSGRNVMKPARDAKIRKTRLFFEDRQEFLRQLNEDLWSLRRKSVRDKLPVCVRLNCYSDILWEKIKFNDKTFMEWFFEFQFYDYTKISSRLGNVPVNYHLTFSRSESNEKEVDEIIQKGYNVAVVFRKLPETFKGVKVVDGDVTDMRFKDENGVIVGLIPKGRGKKDTEGFVV